MENPDNHLKKKRTQFKSTAKDVGIILRRIVDDGLTIPDHLNCHFTHSKGDFERVN